MKRVAIFGCSGGGKSTLARKLGAKLGVPVIHLDVLFWQPNWTESETEPFRQRVEQAVAAPAWVTDGNFISTTCAHLAGADTIIWVDQPRWLCVWRALWRAISKYDQTREDMAEGCRERIDFPFLLYIWNWNRLTKPRFEAKLAEHAASTPLIRLTSDRQIAAFLASVD